MIKNPFRKKETTNLSQLVLVGEHRPELKKFYKEEESTITTNAKYQTS